MIKILIFFILQILAFVLASGCAFIGFFLIIQVYDKLFKSNR